MVQAIRMKLKRSLSNAKMNLVFRNVDRTLESDKHAVGFHVAPPSFPKKILFQMSKMSDICFQCVSPYTKWIASSIFLHDLSLSHDQFTKNARMFYL